MNNTKLVEITEEDMNILKKRKAKKQARDLLELYLTEFPARREEEPITESEEEFMTVKCCLCGRELGYYDKRECGRPLIDGIVCADCKVKARNYEDELKKTYPNSIRYYPTTGDLERE